MRIIEASDEEARAAGQGRPRVTLADMESKIVARYDVTALRAVSDFPVVPETLESLAVLSVCIVVMKNGLTLIGKSAPASPENFNAEFGKKLAYEDVIRQLWPLEGYLLRDNLASNRE